MVQVLCPVDFSSCSLAALDFASNLVNKLGGRVNLYHVFSEASYNEVVNDNQDKSFKEKLSVITSRLEKLSDDFKLSFPQVDFESDIVLGDFDSQVLEYAHEQKFDFVVMGVTGNGVGNAPLGTNVRKIKEHIESPLLLISEKLKFDGFDKIVYACDFLAVQPETILKMISLATRFNARIKVLSVTHTHSDEKFLQYVEEIKSFIQYDKISFEQSALEVIPEQSVSNFVESENGDLLIISKQDRTFVEPLFQNNKEKELLRLINRPLLII